MANREKYYINLFKTFERKHGFNLTLGGEYGTGTSIKKKITHRLKAKDVYVYRLNGDYIGKFNSVPDVAEILQLNRYSVMNALQRSIQLKGYLFFRSKQYNIKYYPRRTHFVTILVYNDIFEKIDRIDCMTDCAIKYNISINSINTSCNRLQKCHKKYYFVRLNNIDNFTEKYDLPKFIN